MPIGEFSINQNDSHDNGVQKIRNQAESSLSLDGVPNDKFYNVVRINNLRNSLKALEKVDGVKCHNAEQNTTKLRPQSKHSLLRLNDEKNNVKTTLSAIDGVGNVEKFPIQKSLPLKQPSINQQSNNRLSQFKSRQIGSGHK